MKRNLFQAAVVSILPYGCTTWKLTKPTAKKLDRKCTRKLRTALNKKAMNYIEQENYELH